MDCADPLGKAHPRVIKMKGQYRNMVSGWGGEVVSGWGGEVVSGWGGGVVSGWGGAVVR